MVWGVHVTLVSRWLDPGETEALITPFMVLYALHDALVKPMPGNISTPSLAESWSVSKDGITYDFVLRKNAKFHNGDPVTAEDVKFTFERYKGASARLLKDKVKEVQVVAPNRVRFVLKEAWPDFIAFYGTSATGASWIVPKKYVEKVGEEGYKKAPVGAGPFKFVSFQPGIELVLEAFPDYWRKAPQVKRIVMRSIPDESTRAAAVKTGEVDIAYLFVGAIAEELQAHARSQDHGSPALRHLLARLPRSVGPEVSVARQARPPGGEPRHRSRRNQPGRDAGLRQSHRRVRAAGVRLRAQGRAAAARYQARQAAHDRGRLSQRLRRGRPHAAPALHVARRDGGRLSPGHRHPHQGADHGARDLHDHVAREEAERAPHRRDRCGGQRGGPTRAVLHQGRPLRVRLAARDRRPLPAAGQGARPQEAGGDAPSDPEDRHRSGDGGADLPARIHLGRELAGRGFGRRV